MWLKKKQITQQNYVAFTLKAYLKVFISFPPGTNYLAKVRQIYKIIFGVADSVLLLDTFLIRYISSMRPSVLQPLRGCGAGPGSGCIGNYRVIYKPLRSLHNVSPERTATIIMIRLVVKAQRGSASAALPYVACRIARSHTGLPSVLGLMLKHVSGM